jgi:molybdate transport system regulatory protein
VELAGVATVPESLFEGEVLERDGELATLRTPAGEISARVPTAADTVEVAVRADAVVLMEPGSPSQVHTSLRNQLAGVVVDVTVEDALASVTVEVAEGVTIDSVVTETSVDRLGLETGREVIAAFKSTAARATAVDGGTAEE